MSQFPSITGSELIKALSKIGFFVVTSKEAIIASSMRMEEKRQCPSTERKPSGLVFF